VTQMIVANIGWQARHSLLTSQRPEEDSRFSLHRRTCRQSHQKLTCITHVQKAVQTVRLAPPITARA